MSLDIETRLRTHLASATQTVRVIQTLEISHSAMTRTYYLWREPYEGEITTDDGVQTVEPVNLRIDLAGSEGHLDQNYEITVDTVDIEDEFREQMDLIPIYTLEKIRCVYREYLSDDLTESVVEAVLQVDQIAYKVGVASIMAIQPRYNTTSTGERYIPRDIPMLRSFL